jgi:Tfp pilus assembly protein PilO
MMKQLERIYTDLDRWLANSAVAVKLYAIIFALTVVIFGHFGITPLYRVIRKQVALSQEMRSAYKTMQRNLTNLGIAEKDLNENTVYIGYLRKYMPVQTNTQSYMLDFIDATGSSGYQVERFAESETRQNLGQVDLAVSMQGAAYPSDIVEKIEILKRVTQVTSLHLNHLESGGYGIDLMLTIYTLII